MKMLAPDHNVLNCRAAAERECVLVHVRTQAARKGQVNRVTSKSSRRDFMHKAALTAAGAVLLSPNTRGEDAMNKVALIADPLSKEHLTGDGHPECPARFDAVLNALKKAGLDKQLTKIDARDAVEEELSACHTAEYLRIAKRDITSGLPNLSTGDTQVSAKSWDAAMRACGGVLKAVDAVIEGKVSSAFCVGRPPGHHATSNRGMGFCVVNNIAVAARYAQQKHKIGKVLIADWDVHHGNGTQDIFYDDNTVFFFSTHQSPWYPGTGKVDETGAGKGLGYTLNCPFPAESGRKEILGAFQDKLLPAMKKFKPELVLISAGFDSRDGDPLGRFTLSDNDFVDLTTLMQDMAREYAKGRLISVLEGGYNLEGLGTASCAHVQALLTSKKE
jgi:acetoin utilization deacetylase AcuC-like enzyme